MHGQVCTEKSLVSQELQRWANLYDRGGLINRKVWEWSFITQTFYEHGKLSPGNSGLVFAVGTEPMVSNFVSFGCRIHATDLDFEDAKVKGWVDGLQHSSNKTNLYYQKLCNSDDYDKNVSFEFLDMNSIPENLNDKFDFCWSTCSLEHLGSIENGKRFIYNSLKTLKRGGVAVHTTEYNVSSNNDTIDNEPTVLFRKCDIEDILFHLKSLGFISKMDWNCGSECNDYFVDLPPYGSSPHLKLRIQNFTVTSIALVIIKP
jgi:SAM-dependent methyltransferase